MIFHEKLLLRFDKFMNSSSSKQKFSDSPIFEPKHINLSSIRTNLYILDVPLLRRHLRYISQTTLKMFCLFFYIFFNLSSWVVGFQYLTHFHIGTALIRSSKISSSSLIVIICLSFFLAKFYFLNLLQPFFVLYDDFYFYSSMNFCCFFKLKGVVENLLQLLLLSKLESRFLQFSEKNNKKNN